MDIFEEAYELYKKEGAWAVMNMYSHLPQKWCIDCEECTPNQDETCLVCGQPFDRGDVPYQTIKVKVLATGEIEDWTMSQILDEINRDHSEEWSAYTAEDWQEGWMEWVDGDYYELAYDHRNRTLNTEMDYAITEGVDVCMDVFDTFPDEVIAKWREIEWRRQDCPDIEEGAAYK